MFSNPDITNLCVCMINISLYKIFQNHSVELLLMKCSSYMHCHIHKEFNLLCSQMNLMTLLPKIEVMYKDEGINFVVQSFGCFPFCASILICQVRQFLE